MTNALMPGTERLGAPVPSHGSCRFLGLSKRRPIVVQLVTKCWIGDRDQAFGAFLGCAVRQRYRAMFRYHPIDIRARHGNWSKWVESRDDPALCAIRRCRREGKNGSSALRRVCAADEVDQPTVSGNLNSGNEFPVGLAEEINFENRIDCDETRNVLQNVGAMSRRDRGEFYPCIGCNAPIEPAASQCDAGRRPARESSGVKRPTECVGNHSPMQSEALERRQGVDYRGLQLAQTELNCISVPDQRSDMVRDLSNCICGCRRFVLDRTCRCVHKRQESLNGYPRSIRRVGHLRIDLSDKRETSRHERWNEIRRHSQTGRSVCWRGYLKHATRQWCAAAEPLVRAGIVHWQDPHSSGANSIRKIGRRKNRRECSVAFSGTWVAPVDPREPNPHHVAVPRNVRVALERIQKGRRLA